MSENITVVIMCGGWHQRYLELVNGEPLVCRDVRLLKELGIKKFVLNVAWKKENVINLFKDDPNITINVCHHHYIGIKNGVPEWVDDDTRTDWSGTNYVESLYPILDTIKYWTDMTIIILGDVYFTKSVLMEILLYKTDDITFFGKDYSKPEGKVLGEINWNHGIDVSAIKIGFEGKKYLKTLKDPLGWINLDDVHSEGYKRYNESLIPHTRKEKLWMHFMMKDPEKYKLVTPSSPFIYELDTHDNVIESINLEKTYNWEECNNLGVVGYAFVSGDLPHYGHLNFLRQCKKHCDFLIVGVQTDDVIASYKRETIIPFEERIAIFGAFKVVDLVVPQTFRDTIPTMNKLVNDGYNIKVLFHGDDWKTVWGTDWIKTRGGTLIQPKYYSHQTTTKIIEKIRSRYKNDGEKI